MKIAVNTAKLLRNVPLPDEIATVHDNAVVLDLGSGDTRIGFSGDDAPRLVAPTVVGTSVDEDGKPEYEFLAKAYKKREHMDIVRVMNRGLVTDWGGMEQLMKHVDKLLGISSDTNTPILISEAALVPKEQREEMVQLLFDKVGASAIYFSMAPVLSLYASGKTTGMVVEMGHGTCHTVPVYEGFGLFHSILQMDFGGEDLTNQMGQLITTKFKPCYQHDIWQYMKELYCPVLQDEEAYSAAVADANKRDIVVHTLPDGTEITLGTDRYKFGESLFKPALIGKGDGGGIHELAKDSIGKVDEDVKPLLYGNVVMSGGSSLFKGLHNRLSAELQKLVPHERVRILAATERRMSTWAGGSILASLPTFQDMWVTKSEYFETGEATRKCIAQRNCF